MDLDSDSSSLRCFGGIIDVARLEQQQTDWPGTKGTFVVPITSFLQYNTRLTLPPTAFKTQISSLFNLLVALLRAAKTGASSYRSEGESAKR